jgi:hypothetical protein|uniref:Uncharacterized protein n=1 Tax=viral metagenome TaxID=1070528 RepID=A0A6C0J163_9ZZZZ
MSSTTNTGSFSVKSSHKFVYSNSENPNTPSTSLFNYEETPKPSTSYEPGKTKGTTSGMVVHTSSTSQEDYY